MCGDGLLQHPALGRTLQEWRHEGMPGRENTAPAWQCQHTATCQQSELQFAGLPNSAPQQISGASLCRTFAQRTVLPNRWRANSAANIFTPIAVSARLCPHVISMNCGSCCNCRHARGAVLKLRPRTPSAARPEASSEKNAAQPAAAIQAEFGSQGAAVPAI